MVFIIDLSRIRLKQQRLDEIKEASEPYPSDGPRMTKINKLLVNFIVQDLQPLSVVENRGFRALVAALDQRVKLPCRSKITKSLLPSMYEEIRSNLIDQLGKISFVSLTTDIWTSKSMASYMTFTVHFIDGNFEMQSKVLSTLNV